MTKKPDSERFAAILLAAGPSSRLGQPKQLVKVNGESLVRRSARLLLGINPVSITVVIGFAGDAVKLELHDLPVRLVRNDDWEQGMGGSIACGVNNIPEEVDGALVMLGDQWRLEGCDLTRLISAWSSDISRSSVASWYERKTLVYGPPALFARSLFHELSNLNGSRGAKAVIGRQLEKVQFVEMKNAAYDLDKPKDLEQLIKRC